jgi:nicotinamide-nucleotide amidase
VSNNDLANALLQACQKRGIMLATAESCTGGMIIAALTDIAGSSAVVDRGFITYSNAAKRAMLGVPEATLATFGAVSRETALAMAVGALENGGVDLVVAITGIAGPGGATPGKPVGLVHFAAAARDGRMILREMRYGAVGRGVVRENSVKEALKMLLELARGPAKVKRKAPAARTPHRRVSRTPRRTAGTRRRTSRP